MLTPNISQLDQLPFLKRQKHKWPSEQQQNQKLRIRLLQHLRCMSYQYSPIMSKLFMFQKSIKKNTSNIMKQTNNDNNQPQQQQLYQQLIVTTQKEIISLEKFFYLLNDILNHQQFSQMVGEINVYVKKCKEFIRDQAMSRFQVDFGMREFLSFGVYMERCQKQVTNNVDKNNVEEQKQNQTKKKQNKKVQTILYKNNKEDFRFIIKCSITTFTFQPFKDITTPKHHPPPQFSLTHPQITTQLYKLYQQLQSLPLITTQKSINKYINYFDTIQHFIDQQYLKLQIFKNYPLLRCKYYLPIVFNDKITNQKLDGPIFSNSNAQCMFRHFYGYNADTIKILQGNNCQQCHCLFQGVQQNPIMTHLRDNLFNPYKADVLYCPQFNRFKLLMKVPIVEQQKNKQLIQQQLQQQHQLKQKQKLNQQHQHKLKQQPSQYITKITYLNYLHLRCNLRKITTKKRNTFNYMLQYQKFPLTFDLWGRKLLIMDPVKGKNCLHYQFTDLRLVYLNKLIIEDGNSIMYKCPICNDIMKDSDILYLKEVQILIKYLKFKCTKYKHFALTGSCFIDHRQSKVFIQYKKPNKQTHTIQTQILQIKNYYQTLIDPYVSFNQYTLGIPDKYQQKIKNKYLFGFDQQNQDKDSQDDFQFKTNSSGGIDDYQSQKLSKRIQKISVENQDQ